MKKWILILVTVAMSGTFALAQEAQYFGEKIDEKGALSTEQFKKAMEGKKTMDVKVQAKIETVCQKKGCWMDLDLGNGQKMKVKFKDYEFFVPKDANGKTAIIQGTATMETTDVATLRHYAEDAGKTQDEVAAIKEPKKEVTFEAVGVIIK